jgi:hypothetical protein
VHTETVLVAGVTVTKTLTSTTRAVLDNVRQIIIWAFSLIPGIEWQEFNPLTVRIIHTLMKSIHSPQYTNNLLRTIPASSMLGL